MGWLWFGTSGSCSEETNRGVAGPKIPSAGAGAGELDQNADYARRGRGFGFIRTGVRFPPPPPLDGLSTISFQGKLIRKSSLALAAVLLLLSGCATVPPPRSSIGPFLSAHRLTIGSIGYLPSSAVVKELGAQERWDPEAQIWSVTLSGHELCASPQISTVLVDGVPHSTEGPPIMREGELLLPESLWGRWLARWGAPERIQGPSQAPGLRLQTIILDPGHGGHDAGAIGRSGLREKSVNLDIALRLRDLLEQDGFRVVMTRSDDRFIPLDHRSQMANQASADLFVSIHSNASRRRSISGFEVYLLSEATDDHARVLEALENGDSPLDGVESAPTDTQAIVWDLLYTEHRAESRELAAYICRGLKSARIPSQNRGVKSARFAVLKGSRMPAVLVEVGFITHPAEESRLRSASYRQQIAEGIRSGILSFKANYEHRT